MKLVQHNRRGSAPLEIKKVYVPDVQITVANAVRVWTDARGKTHFEYVTARPTRQPNLCSHAGKMQVRGPRGRGMTVPYTWARSSMLRLCCGDCGAAL